jgi:hypothetical protein
MTSRLDKVGAEIDVNAMNALYLVTEGSIEEDESKISIQSGDEVTGASGDSLKQGNTIKTLSQDS